MYQERDSILSNKEKETLFKELQQLLFFADADLVNVVL